VIPSRPPIPPRRSVLFVPGHNLRALAKAHGLPCDTLILDLEDSVAPDAKEAARANVVAAAKTFPGKEVIVRINSLDTDWGVADLAALIRLFGDIDGIMAPKVVDPVDANRYAARLGPHPDRVRLWLMIETARSLFNLEAFAAIRRVSALVLGLNDLGVELGAQAGPDRLPFHSAMSMTVLAARAHGISALDSVFNTVEDELGFEREARQARAFGFDGKTLIHPSQIAPCNRAFSPSPEELAWAQAVVDGFKAAEGLIPAPGAIKVDGRMVERLHLDQARRMIAAAERQ
jgi:citrate lyase subunit beta/citryl-CoA lyase